MGLDVNVIQVEVAEVIDVSQVQSSQIEVAPVSTELMEVLTTEVIVVESPQTKVIEVEVRIPGPPGPAGSGETVPYAKRTDFVGNDIVYKGEALPGAVETSSLWRIKKITFVGEDIHVTWAEGDSLFNKQWSARETYQYI